MGHLTALIGNKNEKSELTWNPGYTRGGKLAKY
jgi:hypothetical protein